MERSGAGWSPSPSELSAVRSCGSGTGVPAGVVGPQDPLSPSAPSPALRGPSWPGAGSAPESSGRRLGCDEGPR